MVALEIFDEVASGLIFDVLSMALLGLLIMCIQRRMGQSKPRQLRRTPSGDKTPDSLMAMVSKKPEGLNWRTCGDDERSVRSDRSASHSPESRHSPQMATVVNVVDAKSIWDNIAPKANPMNPENYKAASVMSTPSTCPSPSPTRFEPTSPLLSLASTKSTASFVDSEDSSEERNMTWDERLDGNNKKIRKMFLQALRCSGAVIADALDQCELSKTLLPSATIEMILKHSTRKRLRLPNRGFRVLANMIHRQDFTAAGFNAEALVKCMAALNSYKDSPELQELVGAMALAIKSCEGVWSCADGCAALRGLQFLRYSHHVVDCIEQICVKMFPSTDIPSSSSVFEALSGMANAAKSDEARSVVLLLVNRLKAGNDEPWNALSISVLLPLISSYGPSEASRGMLSLIAGKIANGVYPMNQATIIPILQCLRGFRNCAEVQEYLNAVCDKLEAAAPFAMPASALQYADVSAKCVGATAEMRRLYGEVQRRIQMA